MTLFLILLCQNVYTVRADEHALAEKIDDSYALLVDSEEKAEQIAEALGCELVSYDNNVAAITISDENPKSEEEIKSQADDLGVNIYEEFLYYADDYTSPYGNVAGEQWYAPYIGIPNAWKYSKGAGVRVAVLDSGIDASHPEFATCLEIADTAIAHKYYDIESSATIHFNSEYEGPQDNYSHGTHVSGIIAAANDNVGMVGVAPDCKIISIKTIEKTSTGCSGTTSMIVSAINEAIERDVDIINLSVGGGTGAPDDELLSDAVANAVSNGITVVCAAGNSNTSGTVYPAAADGAIGVSTLKLSNGELTRDSSSRYGFWVDISAPGANIYSTVPGGEYSYKTGTSMATPMITGAIALAKSLKPSISLDEIQDLLYSTATDLGVEGRDDQYGNGAVNAEKMIKKLYDQLHPEEPKQEESDDSDNGNSHSHDYGHNDSEADSVDEQNGNNNTSNVQIDWHVENEEQPLVMLNDGLIHAQDANESADAGSGELQKGSTHPEKSIDPQNKSENGNNENENDVVPERKEALGNAKLKGKSVSGDNAASENKSGFKDGTKVVEKEIIITRDAGKGKDNRGYLTLIKDNPANIIPVIFGIGIVAVIIWFIVILIKKKKDKEQL